MWNTGKASILKVLNEHFVPEILMELVPHFELEVLKYWIRYAYERPIVFK